MENIVREKSNKKSKYSPEYKIYAIIYMREHFLSYKQAARKLLPNQTQPGGKTIRSWVKIYNESGPLGFFKMKDNSNANDNEFRKPIDLESLKGKSEDEYLKIIHKLDFEICALSSLKLLADKKNRKRKTDRQA